MDIKKKIKKAKLKMFTKDLVFFGIQSYKFHWLFEKNSNIPEALGYVIFESEEGNLESGAIHFNQDIFEKDKYDHEAICYTAVHELLHILNRHGNRRDSRKIEIWCVACDHVVEREMRNMKSFLKSPLSDYHIIKELDEKLPKCSTEQAYNWLFNHQSFPDQIKQ